MPEPEPPEPEPDVPEPDDVPPHDRPDATTPEVTPPSQTPPVATDTIKCKETTIDIEPWRAGILESASEMAEAAGVKSQKFSRPALRGNLWELIKGLVQSLCNQRDFLANLAKAIAAAVLAALGLLGLLTILAGLAALFDALLSGGLATLVTAAVAAAATALVGWLASQFLNRPEIPKQLPPSEEGKPEEEKRKEKEESKDEEKKEEEEEEEKKTCGDGEGKIPFTNIRTKYSKVRGQRVVVDPLTRCEPEDGTRGSDAVGGLGEFLGPMAGRVSFVGTPGEMQTRGKRIHAAQPRSIKMSISVNILVSTVTRIISWVGG